MTLILRILRRILKRTAAPIPLVPPPATEAERAARRQRIAELDDGE